MTDVKTAAAAPLLAMPCRPIRPLSSLKTIKVALGNSIAALDQEMFEELIIERRFLWRHVMVVSDPQGIRRVMLDNQDNYPRIPQMRQVLAPALGEGLLSSEGDTWRKRRQLAAPALDHHSVVAETPIIIEAALELADTLAAVPPAQPIDINDSIARLLVRTIARIFGNERIEPLLVAFLESPRTRRVADFLQVPAWLQSIYQRDILRDTARAFGPLLLDLIAERRSPHYQGRRDLLWRLVSARNRATGETFSDVEVRDEVLTLAFGGVDTTMRAISWVWYLLAMHPWAEARVHAEIDDALGDTLPTLDSVTKLVYLRRVVDEALRLYPAIPVMLRQAAREDVICGHRARRGAIIVIAPWVVHRHHKLWTDPDCFDPERFSPENSARRSRYAYIPFALGPHICIGASLAIMEMMLIIAILARRFRFRLVPGRLVRAVGGFLTLRAAGGLWVTCEPRAAREGVAR